MDPGDQLGGRHLGIFNYRDYTTQEAAELARTSFALSVSSQRGTSDDLNIGRSPDDVWSQVAPEALGLTADALDASGFYVIESPITGTAFGGPQAQIWEERDTSGEVTRLSISFAGTNGLTDLADYLQLNSGDIAANFEPLLTVLQSYAQDNGIAAPDVIVTGYSLGAAYANLLAQDADTLAGGFFADSSFVGHAVPRTFEGEDRVLNIGYENDVAHRAAGDFGTLAEAIVTAPGLRGQDYELESSTDNLILFGDDYAGPLWPFGPFALYNLVGGWSAHLQGIDTDAVERVTESAFYDLTDRDSLVIVSNLSAFGRATTWVEDLDRASDVQGHVGDNAFLIGSDSNDLLRGNVGNDYISGGGGDDRIRTGDGADRVEGGAGVDTLELRGHMNDWDVVRLEDGTTAFVSSNYGIDIASGVERVTFRDGGRFNTDRDYSVEDNRLEDLTYDGFLSRFDSDVDYTAANQGTAASNTLSGSFVFALAGDDVLRADGASDAVLVGGEGDDVVIGGRGDDRLYGSEGDDELSGGGGQDLLNGGLGNDIFVFDTTRAGQVTIEDYNRSDVESDVLRIEGSRLSEADILAGARQDANGVTIALDDSTLLVADARIEDLIFDNLLLA